MAATSTVLIDENIPLLAESITPALGKSLKLVHFSGRNLSQEKLRHCEALFVRSVTRVDEHLLSETPVVFVGTATSGLEHIDTDYLRRQNIHFADAQGCNANSVAEYVLYALFKWADARQMLLVGKTLGIVGYGNIGKLVASYASKLGMKVLVNDPPLKNRRYAFPSYVEYAEFGDLVERSDAITNHVPFKREGQYATVGMFAEREFARMRDGAMFIHTSRRFVAIEAELLPHLRSGRLYAAVDVWEQEPRVNKDLAECCLLATPHIAGYSYEGKIKGALMMAQAFGKFFGYKPDMSVFDRALARKPDEPLVDVSASFGLYELLRDSRRLDEDTDMLLETLSAPEFQHPALFDRLRKNYPLRREMLLQPEY